MALKTVKVIKMARFHATAEGNIPFTAEEELEWDAQETTFAQELPKTEIKAKIAALETSITPRRQREAILSIDTTWLADVEIQIGQLRQQLAAL
jgi:hypothetical protein